MEHCKVCKETNTQLYYCGACLVEVYCSEKCQRIDYPMHICKRGREEGELIQRKKKSKDKYTFDAVKNLDSASILTLCEEDPDFKRVCYPRHGSSIWYQITEYRYGAVIGGELSDPLNQLRAHAVLYYLNGATYENPIVFKLRAPTSEQFGYKLTNDHIFIFNANGYNIEMSIGTYKRRTISYGKISEGVMFMVTNLI